MDIWVVVPLVSVIPDKAYIFVDEKKANKFADEHKPNYFLKGVVIK